MHVRTTADRRPSAARGRAGAGLARAGKRGGRARAGIPFFGGRERGNEQSEEKNKDKTQLDSELCYDGSVVKRTKRTRHRGRCRSPRACCSQLTAERLSFLLEMNIGVTHIQGQGAFSGNEKTVIMAVMRKSLSPKAEEIVREEDPEAFMIVTDATEIYGEGYKNIFSEKI